MCLASGQGMTQRGHRTGEQVLGGGVRLVSGENPQMNSTDIILPHVCPLTESLLTLCNPMDCSLLVSSVHGLLQARILERVAMPHSRDPT